MIIIDGKKVAAGLQDEMSKTISALKNRPPCLAFVQVGQHPPSRIYINRKTKACLEVGIRSIKKELPETISQKDLLVEIDRLNAQTDVDGILVQLPLPKQINPSVVCSAIDPHKDVDGFHPINMGKLLMGETDGFVPCTPLGIKILLEKYNIEVTGKHAVIVGRSNIVGKPMAALLIQTGRQGNATVTITHQHTKHLADICRMADLLIVAIGKPKFITADMVKENAIVIDVGINKIESQIIGDVDFNQVKEKCSYITPVPGGVGPMTIAALLQNTFQSYLRSQNKEFH